MDSLMMSGMLFRNFLIVTSSVIDLQPCLSINSRCMLSSALAKRCTPARLPSLFGVTVCHSFHTRYILIDGIRMVCRANMNLTQVWSFSCPFLWNWLWMTNALFITLNPTNYKALLSFKSISLNVKNLSNTFTHWSNLCEFFHLLSCPCRVSGGSRFQPVRALLFLVVLLIAITRPSDSHSSSSGDFSGSKFLLVAVLGLVIRHGDLGQSDSLLMLAALLSLWSHRFTPFAFPRRLLQSAWHCFLDPNILSSQWSHVQVTTSDQKSH